MHVDDDDRRLGSHQLEFAQDDGKRVVDRVHEDTAHDVQHADPVTRGRPGHVAPASGGAWRIVCRAQQARLVGDVIERLFLVPHVVAGRHHIDAVRPNRVAELAGDAEAAGGIFDIRDHQVDAVVLNQRPERRAQDCAARLAHDIADEQDLHA